MVYYAYELDDSSEESLWHHGVSGQKWGVRNGPPYPVQSGTKVRFAKSKMTKSTLQAVKKKMAGNNPIKKSFDERYLKTNKILISKLSDEELNKRIGRLKIENEYKKLLYENKYGQKGKESKKKDNGEQKTQSTMGKIGQTLMEEIIKSTSGYVNQRLTNRANTKAEISSAKAQYKANAKAQEYADRAHHDELRRNSKQWLNDSENKVQNGWWVANYMVGPQPVPAGYDSNPNSYYWQAD